MNSPQWDDVDLAAAAFAVAPSWLGGVALHGLPGPVRDSWLQWVRELLPAKQTLRRIPLHVSESQLLGGLDLTATLSAGRPIAATGLLADCNGGVVVLAMAERAARSTLSHLASALDFGEVVLERDGFSARLPADLGVIALDEAVGDDEALSAVLSDRLALSVDLRSFGIHDVEPGAFDADTIVAARNLLADVNLNEPRLAAICGLAQMLGVTSLRACQLAARTARVVAALSGRLEVDDSDIAAAARLVLSPRATRVPVPDVEEDADRASHEDQSGDGSPSSSQQSADAAGDRDRKNSPKDNDQPLEDRVLDAVVAAIPAHLLAQLKAGDAGRQRGAAGGKSGAIQRSHLRGRPKGVVRGHIRTGARLSLMDTLRAAAPWQKLRRQQQRGVAGAPAAGEARVLVRPDDFHVRRFKQRSETTTIFVVDASGSAALHRLAEAKGAVELLLADCYVRRDQVALIAFRGHTAELLLPPTRSLVRAKRSIAALPGGGGTPLAAAVDAAGVLAEQVMRRGGTPGVIFLTDGRANISREGGSGREQALNEALEGAAVLRFAGVRSMVIDTAPRPHANAARLAEALAGVYLPLPHADAAALSRAAQAAARAGDGR